MYTPYPHQDDAVNSIYSYYGRGNDGNPLVAMPTATGKSLVIAEFAKRTMHYWPTQRIIMLTHVKELIKQNAEKILAQWPTAPLGIFSAGLGMKQASHPIIYGGIGSVVNCIAKFGHRDIMLVDEAHLISPKDGTNYQEVIRGLRKINPNMKVIGFTATPYRMGQGLLTEGKDRIFTDICFDLTSLEEFNKLIAGGYLVPPIPKRTETELDVTGVRITNGDFNREALQEKVDIESVTYAACKEAVEQGADRISWLAFASGITHAEHIATILQSMGVDALPIHSKLEGDLADKRIALWKAGKLYCAVNYGKLTTGVDHPACDFILMLRPTTSTDLWVQMLGRGIRPSPVTRKENCLVLDFARNTLRLGPINDPVIPGPRNKSSVPGVPPIRICGNCGVYNHARAIQCIACGFVFPKIEKLIPTAGTEELLRQTLERVEGMFDVQQTFYNLISKIDRKPMIRVQYICGLKAFSEFVCLEHEGYALKKAKKWWLNHMGTFVAPPTCVEAMKAIGKLREPKRIKVWLNKKYPEVVSCEY